MGHIDLRPLRDDDVDAVFEMMRDQDAIELAAFTADDPADRQAFDGWMTRIRERADVESLVITEDGGFAGTAGTFTVDGDREVTYWVAHHAWGRGVATEALRLLVAREPVRPLFARVAAHNVGSIAVLERNGFTEVSRLTSYAPGVKRDVEEIVFALMPALDGV